MRVKAIEIRDKMTFIAAVAVDMNPDVYSAKFFEEKYLLRRAGYACDQRPIILLTRMDGKHPAYYDPYDWGDRTWKVAHDWISRNWYELEDGSVVDVEYILKETEQPKQSERLTYPA